MILNGGGHILWNLLRKGLECLCVQREPSWLLFFYFWSYHLGCSFYKIWAEQKIKRLGCSTVGPTQRFAIVSFFILFIYIYALNFF